jgi:hypothetical protein
MAKRTKLVAMTLMGSSHDKGHHHAAASKRRSKSMIATVTTVKLVRSDRAIAT